MHAVKPELTVWSREEFNSYSDPTYFTKQLQTDSAALYKRMEALFSPLRFQASLPEGVTPQEKERFFATVKKANLFSWQYLMKERDSLLKIEQASRDGNLELAVALIKSGMPISERDFQVAMDRSRRVVKAIVGEKPALPVPWFKRVVLWAREKRVEEAFSLLLHRPDIGEIMSQLEPDFVRQNLLPTAPFYRALFLKDLDGVQREVAPEFLSWHPYGLSLPQLAARFSSKEICDFILQKMSDLQVEIKHAGSSILFPAQRSVLIQSSKYFEKMLTGKFVENSKTTIPIDEKEALCFKQILACLHTGRLLINQDNFTTLADIRTKPPFSGSKKRM